VYGSPKLNLPQHWNLHMIPIQLQFEKKSWCHLFITTIVESILPLVDAIIKIYLWVFFSITTIITKEKQKVNIIGCSYKDCSNKNYIFQHLKNY
jgi:hypothetical protein